MTSPSPLRLPTSPLAIVGASVRAAAASAARIGLDVVAADLFADLDLRRVARATQIGRYPDGLLHWLRGVAPKPAAWIYTGALENYPELVDAMAAECPLLGNPGSVLRAVRSPWELAESLRIAGLAFPETRRTADALPRDGSWLAKTCRGSSGSGVRALDANSDMDLAPADLVYQRQVAGVPGSAVLVAAAGRAVLLGIVRQLVGETWLGAGAFQYCGAIGPWPVAEATRDEIERIGNVLAKQFGLMGLFGVDFIVSGECVWTIEVNPRYTASTEIVERVTGVDAIAAHTAACCSQGLPLAPATSAAAVHGKAIVFAQRTVHVSRPLVDWALGEAQRVHWPMLSDISPAGTTIDAKRPILTAFASGTNHAIVEQDLHSVVASIERKLYSAR